MGTSQMAKHPRSLVTFLAFSLVGASLVRTASASPSPEASSQPAPAARPAPPPADARPAMPASSPAAPASDAKPPASAAVAADEPPPAPKVDPAYEVVRHERRAGFTFGIAPAFTFGTVAGYPNDARKIGRAASYTETGFGVGGAGSFWLGGALTDWFVFGAGLAGNRTVAGSNAYTSVGFTFHLEGFPLYPLGGAWRDAGLFLETGLVTGTLSPTSDATQKLVDGGSASRLGVGAFWEGLRFSRFAAGPFASLEYVFSDSLRHGAALVGFRTVLYARKLPYPPPAAPAAAPPK